jgi:hypothetical protein
MPTYTPLQSIQLASTSTSLVFSNIPQTYQDLVLVTNAGASGGIADLRLRLNGDTGQNYSQTILTGDGSTASSTRTTNTGRFTLNYWGALPSTIGQTAITITHIMNYSNNTTRKTCLNRANNAGIGTDAQALLWNNTSAITSMEIHVTSNSIREGSTFDLYGISPVAADTAQAFGGTEVYYDSTYVYHVFKDSGVFIPYRNLTCDVLVIAGGGGGGCDQTAGTRAGGGGAGGVSYQTGRSVSSAITVTVGAGGTGKSNVSAGNGTAGANSVFDTITSNGGGFGAGVAASGNANGGSGGSGGGSTDAGSAGTATQGNTGGATGYGNNSGTINPGGGGGGGAGAAGSSQNGGNGLNTWSSWATATSTGVSGYYAGGGGGRSGSSPFTNGTGGLGGGGAYGGTNSGVTNTGGGGGGGGGEGGANGGSGLVIIRYAR